MLIVCPDFHLIYVRWTWHTQTAIEMYIRGHPQYRPEDFQVLPSSLKAYREYQQNKHDPQWWIDKLKGIKLAKALAEALRRNRNIPSL